MYCNSKLLTLVNKLCGYACLLTIMVKFDKTVRLPQNLIQGLARLSGQVFK